MRKQNSNNLQGSTTLTSQVFRFFKAVYTRSNWIRFSYIVNYIPFKTWYLVLHFSSLYCSTRLHIYYCKRCLDFLGAFCRLVLLKSDISKWFLLDSQLTINDTRKEKPCFIQFNTRIYWNRSLAASDLFCIFTQLIRFYTSHCHILKIINDFHKRWFIKQTENKWLLLSASFTAKFELVFVSRILTGKKHPQIKLQHLRKVWIWTFGSLVH